MSHPALSRLPSIVVAVAVLFAGRHVGKAEVSIPWRSGASASDVKSSEEVAKSIQAIAADSGAAHLVVRFANPIKPETRAAMNAAGLELQGYVSQNTFMARVHQNRLDIDKLVAKNNAIVDVSRVMPVWKLHPLLAAGERPEWAVVADAESENPIVGAYILFHPDVPAITRGAGLVRRLGGLVRAEIRSINGLVIELPLGTIPALAAEDAVLWIEPPLPRMSEMNNSNRIVTEANAVQGPPYGLDGSGVTVLVYDGGFGRSTHVDFGGRHVTRDSSGLSDHATHVACTIGGSGSASGGTYRGMAPGVLIESYGFDHDGSGVFLYSNPGDIESDYGQAINTHGADIANNSIGTNTCINGFPCDITGDYGVTSALIDAIVGGSLGAPFRIVWANGNERSCGSCPGEHQAGYHSTAPPACAKNHITVGALNSNDDSQTSFTSWGPTDDGRLKPDIAAPGCQSNDDFDVTSCSSLSDTSYTGKCGTSMAAPTVTGLSALLLQDFRVQFPGEPDFRNSMLKVFLTHNAVDLSPPGPDYKAGYGSVRIQQTIDFMRTGSFTEAEVAQGGVFAALVIVNPGDAELKVTIAWDDVPALPLVTTALVNDVDLVVLDPSGVQHFPWTLDPGNPSTPAIQTQADRVNNIEQVYVANPASGAWRVEIHGFNIPIGLQSVSMAASPVLINCSTIGVVSLDRVEYACESTADVQVVDCDLNTDDALVETLSVTITSDSEPVGETVLLTETAADSAAFTGTIVLSESDSAGVLQIAHGEEISATYLDADDGFGNLNVTVEATSVVDCAPPVVSFVDIVDVEPRSATVTFGVDEPVLATVRYGLSCGALTESVSGAGYRGSHSIALTGLTDATTYYLVIDAEDQAGNAATEDNGGACFSFSTPDIPDYFTEEFSGDYDLAFKSVGFTPNGSVDFYASCLDGDVSSLPTDPADGTTISLSDDDFRLISVGGGQTVSLYGNDYNSFFIGSNGFITFIAGDDEYSESLNAHFSLPRISALFNDFNPSTGGTISWKQMGDRIAVTWENVPEFGSSNSNTFQVEMFFDGSIFVTYLAMAANDGIAGLSAGDGLSPEFFESDLTAQGACVPFADCDNDGDTDQDDFDVFEQCFTGDGGSITAECRCANFDGDNDVDCRDWNEFRNLWDGPGDPPDFAPCEPPVVDSLGGRYLSVTPYAGTSLVALLVTADSENPNVACLSKYVQSDGTLGTDPVYQTSTEWDTITVFGPEIGPNTRYYVSGDYGTPETPVLTPADSVTTDVWGDANQNTVLNFVDVQLIILGFQSLTDTPLEAMDIEPCAVNREVNIADVLIAILSWQGVEFWTTTCQPPCP